MTSSAYNGPEIIAAEVKAGLVGSGSAPHYIDPDCPWQNGFIECFHGKLRDKFLSREVFAAVKEAQVRLAPHRHWYNEERPHSSLNHLSPVDFQRAWQQKQNGKRAIATFQPAGLVLKPTSRERLGSSIDARLIVNS